MLLYDLSYINQDFWKTSGVDLGLAFDGPDSGAGQWGVSFNGSYILEYDITSESQVFDGVGSHNSRNQGVQMPEWRGNVVVDWQRNNHYVRAAAHYISSLEEDNPNNPNTDESAFTTVDLLYDYTLPGSGGASTLTFSVQNLADAEDPFKDNALSTSTSRVYDVRGRRIGLAWRQSF